MSELVDLYGIMGAGGFAREVMPIARQMLDSQKTAQSGNYELVFVDESSDAPTSVNGYRVMSEAEFIATKSANKYFNIAIADHKLREKVVQKMAVANIPSFTIAAPNAVLVEPNEIGEGAIFCWFSNVTPNSKIGRFFHLNSYSYVAHDCVIGDFVTFAPGVHCNGNVTIEDYAYIGTGVIIKPGTREKPLVIGKGAVVGMGALVTKNVAPFTTVVGNPAVEFVRKQ